MADLLPIPQPSAMNDPKGQTTEHGYRYLQSLDKAARAANAAIAAAAAEQDAFDVTIAYPANGDYPIEINAPYGYTISQVDSKCSSGSCTATFKIGSTALGGGANSVSTTLQTKTHTSANTVAVADTTTLTISSNSSCVNLRLTVWFART